MKLALTKYNVLTQSFLFLCYITVFYCRSILYIDSKRVLQNKVYILYTVIAFYDNVPTN